jgi:hypothetical protein
MVPLASPVQSLGASAEQVCIAFAFVVTKTSSPWAWTDWSLALFFLIEMNTSS